MFVNEQQMLNRLPRRRRWSRSYNLHSAASRLRIPCCSVTTPALRQWPSIETRSRKSLISPVCHFSHSFL